ncbi:hypothetical protein [Parasphingorhabdus sp.]|uniref:hypothetical protein n=1 Tax=Parasphingorhabdus sp. TaxID=2709688 RepID=UPI0032676095
MTNAARIDEGYAFPTSNAISQAYLDTDKKIRSVSSTSGRSFGKSEPVDVGLKSGIKIAWTMGGGEFPEPVQKIIDTLRSYETLSENWDSHGSKIHDARSQLSTMELVMAGYARCQLPALIPLPDGGVGLRWDANQVELEVDVLPDGQCIALFSDDQIDEVVDISQPCSVREVTRLVERFCKKN